MRDLLRMLVADGWKLERQRGSHHQFTHPTKSGIVTIAYDQEGDTIPTGTQKAIFKQAGWK
ncbi:MAG TPA: type II toxin-antitoxin system HicA family toxin [Candidatus Baltobacteraceae bacterium]|nr:type II toxin-antitoxin system HicA family toxin [Candidatus Baltobacteraceae bacterium]